MYNYGQINPTIPAAQYSNGLGMIANNPYTLGAWGQIQHAGQAINTLAANGGLGSVESLQILARIESQLALVTELLRADLVRRNQVEAAIGHQAIASVEGQLQGQYGPLRGLTSFQQRPLNAVYGADVNPIRLRESDSHVYCELFLSQLTVGDVEVEVNGNRIICRTRVPFTQTNRWYSSASMPRGFDFFELPDGRVEFSWTCPVSFQAKEIEASFREGFLCICVPKTEVVGTRQTVKIVKDPTARVQ